MDHIMVFAKHIDLADFGQMCTWPAGTWPIPPDSENPVGNPVGNPV